MGQDNSYLINLLKKDYTRMTPEEITQNLEEFFNNGVFDKALLDALPNQHYILDVFGRIDAYEQRTLLGTLKQEEIFEYINQEGKSTDALIAYVAKNGNVTTLANAMESIQSDFTRAKILLKCNAAELLPYIQDQYYRTQIVKSMSGYNFSSEELLSEIEQYHRHLDEISQISDEKLKAQYISEIQDRDIKQSLLSLIKEPENRKDVIQSFQRDVDSEIESLDQFVQTMIIEFFEDSLGEKFTDDKREKLEIVFNRSDVSFGNLEPNTNGVANHVFRNITISNKHKNSINRNIGFLVHEYSHLFSLFEYGFTRDNPTHSIEEGIADLFGDLVINSYLKKHGEIKIDGKRIRIDNPYVTYSGYNFENAWPRAMLAGLEKKGKDIEAIGEYLLGSKLKFTEMILGKETAETKSISGFGMPYIETNREEIYNSPELDFSNIDENSIYYNRNYILPLFQIQNKLKDKADLVGVLSRGNSYFANYIASKYFEGRKFYEVPTEELKKFVELLDAQITPGNNGSAIFHISEYKNEEINNLTEDIINEHSFEILDGITSLFGNENSLMAGTSLEKCVEHALRIEIEKIESGQPIEVTMQKKDAIVSKYMQLFSGKSESNMYIREYIQDFVYACEQAELDRKNDRPNILSSYVVKTMARQDGVPQKKEIAMQGLTQLQNLKKEDLEEFYSVKAKIKNKTYGTFFTNIKNPRDKSNKLLALKLSIESALYKLFNCSLLGPIEACNNSIISNIIS